MITREESNQVILDCVKLAVISGKKLRIVSDEGDLVVEFVSKKNGNA